MINASSIHSHCLIAPSWRRYWSQRCRSWWLGYSEGWIVRAWRWLGFLRDIGLWLDWIEEHFASHGPTSGLFCHSWKHGHQWTEHLLRKNISQILWIFFIEWNCIRCNRYFENNIDLSLKCSCFLFCFVFLSSWHVVVNCNLRLLLYLVLKCDSFLSSPTV